MSESLTIADGMVVGIHYTLTDDEGTTLDSSAGRAPLFYLHGAGNIVEGLEDELVGKTIGDKLTAHVPPAKGYGELEGPGPQAVPKSEFKGMDISKGMPFRAQASNGETIVLWITDIRGSRVYVDTNHPLAGKTLHFDVEVIDLREASEDEKAHGHAHGPDGHHHHH